MEKVIFSKDGIIQRKFNNKKIFSKGGEKSVLPMLKRKFKIFFFNFRAL